MRLPLHAWLALCLWGCASSGAEEAESRRYANRELVRPGFRLAHPENWSVDDEAPGYDADGFFVLDGPDGASVAFLIHGEPADPLALAAAMAKDHGLSGVREQRFSRWGRYDGVGFDLHGRDESDLAAGMRVFAWSSDNRSFLIAESYHEFAYAAARPGFEVIELSFALEGEGESWPAVSHGAAIEPGERLLVREAFELSFPDDWSVDVEAPGYDPDRFFTLESPFAISWIVLQILEGPELVEADVLAEACAGLAPVLEELLAEETFARWGSQKGSGRALRGKVGGLEANLRVFARVSGDRALLVTEFFFEELRERLESDYLRIAASFAFRG